MDVPVVESSSITESINALEDIPTQIPTLLATDPAQPTIQTTPTQIRFPDETDSPGNTNWLMIAGPVLIGLFALVVIVLVVRWIRR
jgi:tetrahydromethanopterin S-methyltransferase subunit B